MVDYGIILQDIWAEWAPLIVVGGIAVIIAGANYYKKHKQKKKAKEAMARQNIRKAPIAQAGVQQQPVIQNPMPIQPIPMQPQPAINDTPSIYEEDFLQTFGERELLSEDITENLATLSNKMEKATAEMDKSIDNDIKKLSKQLLEVNKKKEQVRTYGKKLAKLFNRYEEKEKQVATTLEHLEKIAVRQQKKRQAQQKQTDYVNLQNMPPKQ